MKIYVLDASVVLTFLLGKNQSLKNQFTKILKEVKNNKAKFYSSHLLPLEIGNGLRYSLANKVLADDIFQKFSNLPIEYSVFSPPQLAKIIQLSYLFETFVYDTSYHFLAKRLRGVFLTCDAKYFRKAEQLGNIKLL